jgi:hypothetical protein
MSRAVSSLMIRTADAILATRTQLIEELAASFAKRTSLDPAECELVEEWRGPKTFFYFRKRNSCLPQDAQAETSTV